MKVGLHALLTTILAG